MADKLIGAGQQMAQRQKYWTECHPEERLEVLRMYLVGALERINELTAMVAQLQSHEHSASGRMMAPLGDGRDAPERYPRHRYTPTGLCDAPPAATEGGSPR